ncbi:MAG: hypothetical protein HDS99_03760 [Bacteroidales bacterium]|nr:hypothetical protein [Bacteroidales bacterium]
MKKFKHSLIMAILCFFVSFPIQAQTLLSSDPADGAELETFSGVTLSFDETVTTKSNWSTDIKITTGSQNGTKISLGDWILEKKDDQTVYIYPTISDVPKVIEMEGGTDYYLTIPAGEIKEYTEDIVLHFVGAGAAIALESASPANGASVESFTGVTLTFNQKVTKKSSWSTAIQLATGSATGSKVSVAEWELEQNDDNSVRIYPGNSSGTLSPVEMLEGTDYYLTIPAGEIKEYTEPIVLHYKGATPTAEPLSIKSCTPADGSSVESFDGVTIQFSEAVSLRSSWTQKIVLTTGSADGQTVNVYEWEMEKSSDNAVHIYPGNSSGNLAPIEMLEGTDYYITIPAGEVKEYTEPIVLHYKGATAVAEPIKIESITPADGASVESFDGVTILFSDVVSLRAPWSQKIKIATGSADGLELKVDEWEMVKSGDNGVRIYPGNNSGNLAPIEMLEGTDYYITIPAGEVKEYTEPIVLHYKGATAVAEPIEYLYATPADGSVVSTLSNVTLKFSGDVTLPADWTNKITLSKGSATDGEAVSVAEWQLKLSGTDAVVVTPANSISQATPIDFEAGAEYYLTIPGGIVAEWKEDIVLHYIAPKSVADHKIMLYGTILYSDSWETGKSKVGMYRISATGEGGFEPVLIDSRLSAQMGGAKAGNLYFASFGQDIGLTTLWVNTLWNTETWEVVNINANGAQNSMASCLTTDPETQTVYGSFADGTFGTIDPETCKRTTISDLENAWNAVACTADGRIFAVDMSGNLLSVDKETGATTLVGSTGLTPKYMTSAAIDPLSGRMFYALHTDDNCAVYEISTEDASATKMFDMPGKEWFAGMYIPGNEALEEAPAAPSKASVNWTGATLNGIVKFTAPAKTYGGTQLNGSLSYTVSQGAKELASGSCTAGAEVEAQITVAQEGMTNLIIRVANQAGTSPAAYINVWAGADTPDAPAEVTLAENPEGGYTVAWSPVTTGINGGWVDPEEVTYTVTRMPDNVKVAENISETSFVDLNNNISGILFHYVVTASYSGKTSAATSSPQMKAGVIIPPYSVAFDNAETAASFSVVNANNDSEKWEWNASQKAMRISASSARAMDDWLISPAIELAKGYVYTFSVKVKGQSNSYTEKFEVKIGNDATAQAMTATVIEPTEVTSNTFADYSAKVRVDKDGIYYFGIHGISEPDTYSLSVSGIEVSEGIEGEYKNLAIEEAAAPRYVEAGQRFIVNARVANRGTIAPVAAALVIMNGDDELGRTEIPAIEPGKDAVVGVELAAERSWNHFTELNALIDWNDDADADDNFSQSMTMLVHVPALPKAAGVSATLDNGDVLISWNEPTLSATEGEEVTETFEDYDPFEYKHSGEWVYYDADGMPCFGFANEKVGFPGMEEPSAFFVFDVSYRNEYRNQASLKAHSGDKYLASFASKGEVETENWVISPRLSGAAQTISFYAKGFDPNYGESFEVLVSEKGMAESDFKSVKNFRNISSDWTLYSVDIPANSIFFAIRHNSVNTYMMMVDDVKFIPAGEVDHNLQLVGYNIYCDGQKLNDQPITDLSFRHSNASRSLSDYALETVYNKGVSEKHEFNLSGIDNIQIEDNDQIEYYNTQGIRISEPTPGTVVIIRRGTSVTKRVM